MLLVLHTYLSEVVVGLDQKVERSVVPQKHHKVEGQLVAQRVGGMLDKRVAVDNHQDKTVQLLLEFCSDPGLDSILFVLVAKQT